MKFLSREVALYLYKSAIRPCMEYCCHVWEGAFSCYLELLDELQKQIYRTVGPSLAASLEPLAHCRNVASVSLFYKYYFVRSSAELARLVPVPFSRGRSTRYSERLHDFSVTISRCYKDVYVNSFPPCTARLSNSVPIECFPLTYNVNGFKSRINRYLLICMCLLERFPVCFYLFVLLFLVTPCLLVAVQPCIEWIPIIIINKLISIIPHHVFFQTWLLQWPFQSSENRGRLIFSWSSY